MPIDQIPDGIIAQGGPLDGETFPLYGDPLNPPDVLCCADGEGMRAIYSPRPRTDADDGPLWVYVYLRTEPAPQP